MKDNRRASQLSSQVVAESSNDKILRLAKASGNYLLEGDAFNINKTMVAVMGGSKQFQEIQKRYGLSPLSTSSQAGSIFLAKREKPEGIGCPAFEARKNLLANLLVGQMVMDTSVATDQKNNNVEDGGVPQPPSNVVSTSSTGGALPKPLRSKPSQPEKPSITKQSPSDKKGNSRVRAYFKKLSRELRTTPWFGI